MDLRALSLAYLASLISFLALDAAWLTTMYGRLYKPGLGAMLREQPSIAPAALFYLLYAAGVTLLVVASASSATRALGAGALFGLVAYGTYNLTNYATLRNWPLTVTAADMLWGAFATALAAAAGYWAARLLG